MGKKMRLVKLNEKDNFLIHYGAILITGDVSRLGRAADQKVNSKLHFQGISLLFPSTESYIATSEAVLLCFTEPELNLTTKRHHHIDTPIESSQINIESRQSNLMDQIVDDNDVSIRKYIF